MGVSDSRSACTITRSRNGGGDISEVGSGRCRMSRARAAKAALGRRSCAKSSIKPRGHHRAGRRAGRAGLLAARDGQRAGRLQVHRAAGLESQQNQTAFDACL